MEVDRDVVGDVAVLDLLAAVPPEQVDHRRVGVVVVPRAVQREVTHHGGVVLDRRDHPQPVAEVIESALRIGGRRWREHLSEDVLDLVEHRLGIDAVDDHVLEQHLLVDFGVHGLLADEAAHVVGQLRVLHQRQRLVEGVDEPAFRGGQDDVEQADDIGATGCPGIQCKPMPGTSKCTLRAWI